MNKMQALVKSKREPGLWLEMVDKPIIKDDEVLIKIIKTAICGTDVHIYQWDEWAQKTIPVPMHVGHEFYGIIVEIGSQVKLNLKVGDRVSGEGHLVCHICRPCRAGEFHYCINTISIGVNRPGAFAEYLAMPAFNVFKLPDYISDDVASILDPFGNAIHTALAFDLIGEDILITGAGPIGCMAVGICKKVGARNVVVSDISDYRLNLALIMGADAVINVHKKTHQEILTELNIIKQQLHIESGFDVGLEMSGHEGALTLMFDALMHGGKIAILGIGGKYSLNFDSIIFKGLTIKGIYGREMFETWYKMVALVKSGLNIADIITHHLPMQDYQKAFDMIAQGQCGKVILDWA